MVFLATNIESLARAENEIFFTLKNIFKLKGE